MYEAKVICDSIGPNGMRLTSIQWTFPRVVLAEVVTHRRLSIEEVFCPVRTTTLDLSKNSASSRAIPFHRMLEKVMSDPYIPERFSKSGPGMSEAGWLEGEAHQRAHTAWLEALGYACSKATAMFNAGVHKQDVNRLLEPWAWVTQIATADALGWGNFFALRCHNAAHPAFRHVARMAFLAYRKSKPDELSWCQWHLPYVKPEEKVDFKWFPSSPTLLDAKEVPDLIQFSAARCAWLSYVNHDRDGTPEQMKRTFARLVAEVPIHASPCEHQAAPMHIGWISSYPQLRSNLRGWLQARKLLPKEELPEFNPSKEEVALWGIA